MVNSILSSLLVTSDMPTEHKFHVSLLSRGGSVGKIEIKANSAQLELELELGLSLAITSQTSDNMLRLFFQTLLYFNQNVEFKGPKESFRALNTPLGF